ncbi:hypothetical protein LAT59_02545 [Candidatus Gracilibacteria bacterium]|nr:hypothetical protein [Candidatus Gracilibacteria bacterium]
MKFALVQRLVINFVFLVFLSGIMYFYLYQEIQGFEEIKTELSEDFDYYKNIQKNGVEFGRVSRLMSDSGKLQDSYLRNIFTQLTPAFYTQHFRNTTSESFRDFLVEKGGEIDAIKSTDEYRSRYEMLDAILPIYSPDIRITQDDMSNAEFINNVENLLYSFNLTHRGEIGVRSLSLVSRTENPGNNQNNEEDNLSENIFMIPLDLTIEGMKGNIVNFIHYLSHVGSVTADLTNNSLIPYNDSFLGGSQETGLFSESRYLRQIATIEEINFSDYIDSSPTQSSEDFTSRIRSASQFRERYQVRMTVNFYVAGYPQFRINEAIDDFIAAIDAGLKEMDESLKKASEAFEQNDTQKKSDHRILARTLSRLQDAFTPLRGQDVTRMGQSEVIELFNELQQIKTLKDLTRENYNNFIQ